MRTGFQTDQRNFIGNPSKKKENRNPKKPIRSTMWRLSVRYAGQRNAPPIPLIYRFVITDARMGTTSNPSKNEASFPLNKADLIFSEMT
jgi:hypothetical protein